MEDMSGLDLMLLFKQNECTLALCFLLGQTQRPLNLRQPSRQKQNRDKFQKEISSPEHPPRPIDRHKETVPAQPARVCSCHNGGAEYHDPSQ